MNVIIRKMKIADYEQLYKLWTTTSGMGLNNVDDSKEGIEKYLERNPNTCFVAEIENEIVGAILTGHDGRRGIISHTTVSEKVQRQGIGTKLVDAALEALQKHGIMSTCSHGHLNYFTIQKLNSTKSLLHYQLSGGKINL